MISNEAEVHGNLKFNISSETNTKIKIILLNSNETVEVLNTKAYNSV